MINELLATCPDWIEVCEQVEREIIVSATPKKPSGKNCRTYKLRIWIEDNRIEVSESPVGNLLPEACAERHINYGGSFCVGLNIGSKVHDRCSAKKWWLHLGTYLVCQEFACDTGRWPPGKGLSHGEAAVYQLKAERFAAALGKKQDYLDAVEHGVGSLAKAMPEISKTKSQFYKMNARCPLNCKRKDGSKFTRIECNQLELVYGLVKNERLRRKADADFVATFKAIGIKCCETMEQCPFR
ncbi:MAG: E2 domain-containing protein [Pseudomonadota bacterium]